MKKLSEFEKAKKLKELFDELPRRLERKPRTTQQTGRSEKAHSARLKPVGVRAKKFVKCV